MYPAGSEDMDGGRVGPDADGLGQMEMFENEGGGGTGALGHHNSRGYCSNLWKNTFLGVLSVYISVYVFVLCVGLANISLPEDTQCLYLNISLLTCTHL